MDKNCILCNKIFNTKPSHYERRRYCSKKCMYIGNQAFELRNCIICAQEFKFYSSNKGSIGKYCSHKCKGIDFRIPPIKKQCTLCGNEFIAPKKYKTKKYCSEKCYAKTLTGIEKSSFWDIANKDEQLHRLKESFEKYVIKNGEGCWGWSGSLSKKYGSLQYGGKYKSIGAHRASWILHYGEIPKGMFICHHCDNTRCSRPDHLFLGTPTDNIKDMHQKGRAVILRGEDTLIAKLNTIQVQYIRSLKNLSHSQVLKLSQKYNVAISTIYDVINYRTWRHINVS